MAEIADGLRGRYELCAVAIHHRTGRVGIGETSVVIAVSAAASRDALAACKDAIDTLKERVPLWKKEILRGRRRVDRTRLVTTISLQRAPDGPDPYAAHDYNPIQQGGDWRGAAPSSGPIVAGALALAKWSFVLVKFGSIFIAVGGYALHLRLEVRRRPRAADPAARAGPLHRGEARGAATRSCRCSFPSSSRT